MIRGIEETITELLKEFEEQGLEHESDILKYFLQNSSEFEKFWFDLIPTKFNNMEISQLIPLKNKLSYLQSQ